MVNNSNFVFLYVSSKLLLRFVKPVMEGKDNSWRDAAAELTLTVIIASK